MSQWIWKFGEYEIYHNLLCHSRRQHYGYTRPPMWKLYTPDPVVRFRKTAVTGGGSVRVKACGDLFVTLQAGENPAETLELNGKREFQIPPGPVVLTLLLNNFRTFPCVYVDGAIESDETWLADDNTSDWNPVGTDPAFQDPEQTPEKFPFSYMPISYVKKEVLENGALFDFGKETYVEAWICGISGDKERVSVRFGESREEALDPVWAVIQFHDRPEAGELRYSPCAFRYVFVEDAEAEVRARYEYLPLERRGSFTDEKEILNRIWETAAYTFHLNCREFILDGIKRDGWVWAADAYQSFFVNRYLFFDQALERRTLIALAGKKPMKQHINTIMDYSFFWLISLWDYYETYGDRKFPEQIFPQAEEIMRFCLDRTDADGFMRYKKGDWIFIDWAPMDKTGALCGEQILYTRALSSFSRICGILGKDDGGCGKRAEALQHAIQEKFYDSEKRVFIDSYESGKRNVTRHSNILAYLYLPCTEQQKKDIYERVIRNDRIRQITTPYFKFYENQVHCLAGNIRGMEEGLEVYYGGMLDHGATTFYEEFDPNMSGKEHYGMYGHPFEKSLCHAWSASPIYLLGRYVLGVRNTGIAYDSFEVEPYLDGKENFSGSVPVPGGNIHVSVDAGKIEVFSPVPGGVLIVGERRIPIEAGKKLCVTGFFES